MLTVPSLMSLDSHIEKVLWTQDQISRRVIELAAQITHDFKSISPPPLVVGVATGAFLFLADLVRLIQLPISVDFIRAESYGSGTLSNGAPVVSLDLKLDVKAKHVILVFIGTLHIFHFIITYKSCTHELWVEFGSLHVLLTRICKLVSTCLRLQK